MTPNKSGDRLSGCDGFRGAAEVRRLENKLFSGYSWEYQPTKQSPP
ncbi:hypothetical protein [Microcoleus sp. LEGE 07076]|nr:hypothetical protein [Microcoleus sp. LEGE 07076]